MHNPGECHKRIADAANQYKKFCEQKKPVAPEADGVLIFDEVRVVSRLMWNSRSQRVVGLAMSHDDMACLHDVYQTLDEDATTKSTTYIMQFLWRDLTSPFDVVGPYYSSGGTLEAKFILGIVLETIKVFHLFGFNTSLLVCDGASSNLSTIKSTMGISGVFGRDSSLTDANSICPWFSNPFNPTRNIYWLICPSSGIDAYIHFVLHIHILYINIIYA